MARHAPARPDRRQRNDKDMRKAMVASSGRNCALISGRSWSLIVGECRVGQCVAGPPGVARARLGHGAGGSACSRRAPGSAGGPAGPAHWPGRRAKAGGRRQTEVAVKAVVVTDRAAEAAGITLAERPEPTPAINDVVVEVRASGFVPAEWEWPSTWVDRCGHERVQAVIGHEFAGVVTGLGYGTTGLSLGQRVFGITDWHRDGTLAEYAAVEARNLAPLPGDV